MKRQNLRLFASWCLSSSLLWSLTWSLTWSLSALPSSVFAETVPKVDMNQADAAQLDALLEGVGAKKAQTIVAWRTQHGAFHSVEDVAKVSGMARLAEKNRPRMTFSSHTSKAQPHSRMVVDDHTLVMPFRGR